MTYSSITADGHLKPRDMRFVDRYNKQNSESTDPPPGSGIWDDLHHPLFFYDEVCNLCHVCSG